MERIKALIFLEVALSIETMSELQSNFKRERISSILKKFFLKQQSRTIHIYKSSTRAISTIELNPSNFPSIK